MQSSFRRIKKYVFYYIFSLSLLQKMQCILHDRLFITEISKENIKTNITIYNKLI